MRSLDRAGLDNPDADALTRPSLCPSGGDIGVNNRPRGLFIEIPLHGVVRVIGNKWLAGPDERLVRENCQTDDHCRKQMDAWRVSSRDLMSQRPFPTGISHLVREHPSTYI